MKNFFQSIFSKDKINTGRQKEVDLLRGFTLLIICMCHVGLFLTTDSNSGVYYFADIIGSDPAAPVFMVLMGLSIIYSRKQTALDFLKRGIKLLIISVALNIFRSFPYWITGELDYFACINGFFVGDILQFASLSFLLFALFKSLKMPYWSFFLVSVVFLIVGQILMAHPSTLEFSEKWTYILNFFLPLNNEWCYFNLLTWFIYPCFGLILGELLIRCKNKNKFYLLLIILGSIGFVTLYLNIILRFPNYTEYYFGKNYGRMGILNSVVTILLACFLLGLWYYLGKILPLFIQKYLMLMSKKVTVFFIASWVVISTLIHIQAFYNVVFKDIVIVAFMVLSILLSSLVVIIYKKIETNFKNKQIVKTES